MVEGFKDTEIGILPIDWNTYQFGEISYMKGRIGWQGLNQTEFTMTPDQPFLITGMNFKDGEIRWNEVYHVPEDRYEMAKEIQLKIGDVLLTKDGTIGKLLYVRNLPYPHKATLNSHLLVFRPIDNSYDPLYLYYNLSSSFFKSHIELFKSGTTFFGISQDAVSKYIIPLPPTKAEQTAIAIALNDADALITQLEKLIAKKKAIKQGAMLELLKPKEGWKTKMFRDFLCYEQPIKYIVEDTKYDDHNQIPVLTAGKSFILGYTNEEFGVFDNLPVIIFDDFTTASKFVDFKFKVKSSAMKILKPMPGTNLRFIYELMQTIDFDSTDHKRYWISEYQNIEIKVPSPSEQKKISDILSDMNNEIEKLEDKLEKQKQLKQGIMQNLLTGKIRLV